jgi:1,4-dihydroxy-2-naphthoate octaprenyltransferase
LGEVFVFVFFGLVATTGSAYVQLGRITGLALLASVPIGLLAVALLVVNNLRDIPGDTAASKFTLAVKLGAPATRMLYAGTIAASLAAVALIAVARPGALLALAAAPLAVPPVRRVLTGEAGRGLVAVLQATGRLQLAFGLLLAAGIAL